MVYNSEDCIVALLLWEACDEVHCNLLEWEGSLICSDLIKRHLLPVSDDLILLAVCTSLNVVGYPSAHSSPAAYFGGFSNGFVSS